MDLAEPARETVSPERSLTDRARDGDLHAFEQLYRQHVGRVHAVCLRLAGNRTLAEECTQDAFVRAWESLKSFRGDAAFGTWLHRIAVNTVMERHRTEMRKARLFSVPEEDAMNAVPAGDEPPETALDLEQTIASLPPAARMVFVLYDVEGHTHEEIAALTGLAVGTCKAHLHRARQLLRARLTA
ncbi:MAG TPA: sigma-70 family RNA polymerase sigma factor [Gammaproteobacteria bacterium]|nr:sigma-70 family RNA polymerase sigma factor [Gammaproteobacteria bacterium]